MLVKRTLILRRSSPDGKHDRNGKIAEHPPFPRPGTLCLVFPHHNIGRMRAAATAPFLARRRLRRSSRTRLADPRFLSFLPPGMELFDLPRFPPSSGRRLPFRVTGHFIQSSACLYSTKLFFHEESGPERGGLNAGRVACHGEQGESFYGALPPFLPLFSYFLFARKTPVYCGSGFHTQVPASRYELLSYGTFASMKILYIP